MPLPRKIPPTAGTATRGRALPLLAVLTLLAAEVSRAGDWPMWRHDAGRTASSPEPLPEKLGVLWSRDLPPSAPAYRDPRIRFDGVAEPVVLGKRLILGSNSDDSVTAWDTDTGKLLWKFVADGPIRFAPVAAKGRVIFGSDDGCLYCLRASDGSLAWKKRAVPSERLVLGNGRLISVWPIRGGPVLHRDRVYFTAGVWPLEGTFVFCVDPESGETIWRNDRAAFLYGIHPHNAEAYGGLAPQGYLLVDGEDLVVPCSQAYPARFDLETGELKEFELPAPGRLPGGWFASTPSEKEALKLRRRGLLFDSEVNAKPHEDKLRSEGLPEIRKTIRTREREWSFADSLPGVSGEIASLAAADGKLFVVTAENRLYALGAATGDPPHHSRASKSPGKPAASPFPAGLPLPRHGYALAYGISDPEPVAHLAGTTDLRITGIGFDPEEIRAWRGEDSPLCSIPVIGRNRPGSSDQAVPLPPYLSSLVLVDGALTLTPEEFASLYQSLRPYGGILLSRDPGTETLANQHPETPEVETWPGGWITVTRSGSLPGSSNSLADWSESPDERVRAPFGLLWFGDSVTHFKRSPQPKFVDGVMISNPKDWTDASTRTGQVDYRLLGTTFTDVYTGRQLAREEAPELRQSFTEVDRTTVQPSQYRPPRQKDDWKPEAPRAGERVNPLTGETEPRTFPKSYGCDGGVDYGLVYSMRSGTPAVYDKTVESGTINISGPRSGCTNSVVPANGILNLPYFYEGCTCSYPLPLSLALVGMPEEFEQWASWGEVPAADLSGRVRRVGLNFGAPGDRTTRDGTLWLDVPNVGGPSPEILVTTDPPLEELETHYRHSLFLTEGGTGWPWVAGSGVAGVRRVTLGGLKPGRYRFRMTLSEVTSAEEIPGTLSPDAPATVDTHEVEGRIVGKDGLLTVDLSATIEPAAAKGRTILLHGIEVIHADLPAGDIPEWQAR